MFQHKNYLFWALLKSVDTLSVGDQRGIVELQSTLAGVTKPQTPLGDCALEALCLSLLGGHVPHFLSSSCCVPLDLCPSIPHSLSPKSVGQRWTPVRVCNRKSYGTFLVSFTPRNRAGWVGCQVTYPQTTGQGQGYSGLQRSQ